LFCTRCGHPNKTGAHFCANCGHSLQEDTTVTLTPVEVDEGLADDHALLQEELEEGQALLVVKRGPNAGSTFLIEADQATVTLGRNPESDVFLDDVTVSRKHAEVRRHDEAFHVHDVQSLNGTYVNGERVEETKLATGDEIQVGKFKLLFIPAE
jgi:pSer/pThr/pTyr-binding forkhead associated (FHA) protein